MMTDFINFDAFMSDPVMVLAHSLIGSVGDSADSADSSFQKHDIGASDNGTVLNKLVRNIQLISGLYNGQNADRYDAFRSGLPKQCENLRVFFAEVIYKQIISEVETREAKGSKNTDGPNEELLLLLYLTTILTSLMIQFEHNALTKSPKANSVYSHENLAALSAVLYTLQGLSTNVSKSHTQVMQANAQEKMLLLRESAKSLSRPNTASGGKVSVIEEVADSSATSAGASADSISAVFEQLAGEFRVPPPYHTPYTSPSLLHTIQPTSTTTNTTLHSIVNITITQLTQLCTVTSTNSASRGSKNKTVAAVDGVIREDRSAMLTQSIINVARCWNATSSSVASDRLAAHSILCLIDPVYHTNTTSTTINTTTSTNTTATSTTTTTTTNTTTTTTPLNSAAFTALVPIAMRLLNRYEPTLHTLALVLLYTACEATPPGLLSTFLDWVLPHLYSYIEIVSDDWSRLMAARVIHALLCSDVHSSISLQHSHLYLESSLRQLHLKATVAFAWPYLYHMHCVYTFIPVGVLAIHCNSVVDCYLQLLNVWHLPLQNLVLNSIAALIKRLNGAGLDALVPKIATELVRLNIFYHSPQNDISNASAADIAAVIRNSVVLGRQLRSVNSAVYDTYMGSVLSSVVGMKGVDTASTSSSVRTAGADEHVISVLEKYISDVRA